MKKNLLFGGMMLGLALTSVAQITINRSDWGNFIGTAVIQARDTTNLNLLSPGNAGANQTWDLTGIGYDVPDTTQFFSPAGTPCSGSFPTATLARSMQNFNGFFYDDNTVLELLGFCGVFIPPDTMVVHMTPPQKQVTFPSTYNTSFSGQTKQIMQFPNSPPPPDSIRIISTIDYTSLVDGWGNVTTPGGTYACLRQKYTKYQTDSMFFYMFGTWTFSGPPTIDTTIDYSWWSQNSPFIAFIETDGNGNIKSANYLICTTYNIPATATICSGDSIFLQGNYQTSAGTYYDTLVSVNGCDSIRSTTLTVNPTYNIPATATICSGDSIFLQGNYQTSAGTYYDTLVSVNGCDSIRSTTLTVNPTYNIPATATICSGDSIFLQGNYQTSAGTYYDTLASVNGCDSIRSTTLTVNPTYIISDPAVAICNGDSTLIYGTYKTIAGTYYDTLASVNGCDSIRSTTLTVNPTYIISDPAVVICNGDSALIYGTYKTIAGTYYDTLASVNGCDSIRSTTLIVNPIYNTPVPEAICTGDSIFLQGGWQSTAGTYYDTLTSVNNCDSAIVTTLTVNPLPVVNLGNDTIICSTCSLTLNAGNMGAIYLWNTEATTQTITVSASGTYYVDVTDINNCSASDTIEVTILVGIQSAINNSQSFVIYPNPASEKVIVTGGTISSIEIYNLLGEKVFQSEIKNQKSEIDLSSHPKGIYFVKIYDGDKIYTVKIAIQ